MIRLVLAATLGASYGIYGPAFELCENTPLAPGSEEYLDSEKYELKHRDCRAAWSLKDLIARDQSDPHARIQPCRTTTACDFTKPTIPLLLCYSKTTDDLSNIIIVIVNLDAAHTQTGWARLDLAALGLDDNHAFQAHDLLGGGRYLWQGARAYAELTPESLPAHIVRVRRWVRTERDFDYYR